MRNSDNMRGALRVAAVALTLALVCEAGVAQIGPRYAIELAAGAQQASQGGQQARVQAAGKGLALIRYQGLAILAASADAEAYGADAVREWPPADLLVLTPAGAGRYSGLAPLAALRGLPVVLPEPPGDVPLRPVGVRGEGPRLQPMQSWDALHLRKGRMRLRLTALPGAPGTTHVAGFMLDMGDARASYRVYVSCDALDAEEAAGLAQRLPGADLALLTAADGVRVMVLGRSRNAAKAQPAAVLTVAGFTFTPVKR